jgi:hypothetical protein
MAYTPLDVTKPDNTTQNITQSYTSIRTNDEALLDMLVILGMVPGWDYSYTTGTADAPTTIYWTKSTNTNVKIRAIVTYASGRVETMTFAKTTNNSTYDAMVNNGENKVTFVYDGNGNVTSYAWSVG